LPPFEIILIELALLVAALSFHEAAHAWTANKLGDPTAKMLGRLTLNPLSHIDWIGTILFPLIAMTTGFPMIGWAKPVPVDMSRLAHPRRDFAIVAAAGPISNLILAVGAVLIYRVIAGPVAEMPGSTATAVDILRFFIVLNVMLAVFNMIPIPPLDGGNVLMGLVPEPVARAIDWVRPYGFVLLMVIVYAFPGTLSAVLMPVSRAILSVLL
jgi:Zn-dependent protease